MKKLFTLLLAVAGMVGTVSADDDYDYYVIGTLNGIDGTTNWTWNDSHKMTSGSDGIYTLTIEDVTFTTGSSFEYKVTLGEAWTTNYGTSTGGNQSYTVINTGSGTYTVTFKFDPTNTYDDESHIACDVVRTDDIYLTWGDGNDPTQGQKMTNTNGVYTTSVSLAQGKAVLVVPSSAWSGSSITNWKNVAYPETVSGWYNIYIQHMYGNTENSTSNNYQRWYISEAATYTFTYDSHYNTFTIDAQTTGTISDAGYNTYSTGNYRGTGYTITPAEGATVETFYVNSTAGGKATLAPIASGAKIPSMAGIILKGSGSFTVNTTDASDVDLSGNQLVGTGSSSADVPDDCYILAKNDGTGVGFYKIDTSDKNLEAHKAYLAATGTSRSFIGFEEATGIAMMKDANATETIYNLQGQKVMNAKKGFFIVNGKKIIVK